VVRALTLSDGGQSAADVAGLVAGFVGDARRSLDLALYDVRLPPAEAALVTGALADAQRRGVAVRLLFNVDHPGPIPVPPPPEAEPDQLEALEVETRGVSGIPDLMHHKYVVRDGEAVWSGSTNWTGDSWTRQENVVVTLESTDIAAAFTQDFEQLWHSGRVEGSGELDAVRTEVGGVAARAWFTPGRGEALAQRIATRIGTARRRVRIASPVITSGPVLGTLAQVAAEGTVDVAGVVDRTQMQEVLGQWRSNGRSAWKIPIARSVFAHAPFSGKRSTPYAPDAVHDYMHAKLTVADDTVFVGSYNLSRSGEFNAENVLELEDADLAGHLAAYVDDVRARYPAAELDAGGA
jgi:phosphatidylserine/phosphatidylglycerophosphate/cardiolipin synthase-like enzyme